MSKLAKFSFETCRLSLRPRRRAFFLSLGRERLSCVFCSNGRVFPNYLKRLSVFFVFRSRTVILRVLLKRSSFPELFKTFIRFVLANCATASTARFRANVVLGKTGKNRGNALCCRTAQVGVNKRFRRRTIEGDFCFFSRESR